jgi:hypothetical protein
MWDGTCVYFLKTKILFAFLFFWVLLLLFLWTRPVGRVHFCSFWFVGFILGAIMVWLMFWFLIGFGITLFLTICKALRIWLFDFVCLVLLFFIFDFENLACI